MQCFVREVMKYETNLAFYVLEDKGDILYLQYNTFPTSEKEFKQYFYIHPVPKKSNRQMVMIGCRLLSSKKVLEIKKATMETSILMEWLKGHHIFIEADSLGFRTIRMLGYFFFAHPNITHCTSLKGVLQEALNNICITQDKLTEIDPNAEEFYKLKAKTPEDDKVLEDILEDDDEDEPTDKYDNIPPFEVYSTPVGYGTGTTRVSTRAMCIKSTAKHGKVLHELLLRMKVNQNAFPNIKYIPVGMAATIGPTPYMNLIQQNNVYLTSVATIAVAGIQDHTLNLDIPVNHALEPCKTQTL